MNGQQSWPHFVALFVGGDCNNDGSDFPAYSRDGIYSSGSGSDVGFRPALYCNAES